ncbi:MAG TPA: FG-GAP and VCBS repeat-containing protein [Acidimicrobiia bacterium]|jgi:hypothetical protein
MRSRSFGTIVGASTFAIALAGLTGPAAHAATARTHNATARPRAVVHPNISPSRHRSDFNGDGFDDLVVPAPGESQGSITRSGAITVAYGSASGLTGTGSTTFTQDSGGVPGSSAKRNFWGRTVATGDFNGDGFDDIAIGSQESIGTTARAGTVTILYGSASGVNALGAPTAQLFTATSADVPAFKTTLAYFGGALAVGDFNGDGVDDLAVGAPGVTVAKAFDAGGVTILTGSGSGLVPTGLAITQHHGASGYPELGDTFGASLAAGDLNADHFSDLIVGTPLEDAGSTIDTGVVDVLLGAADLNSTGGDSTLTAMQDVYLPNGDLASATNRRLGSNVAVQSFGGTDTGWVYAPGHLSAGWIEQIDLAHSTLHIHSHGTSGSQHGISLVFGSFSSGAQSSMAIGEPYFDNSGGGQVVVRDGANSTTLSQDTAGVPGHNERGDAFGVNMSVGDYNGDGVDELAVGVPFESINAIYHAGVFYVFPGDALGLAHSAPSAQLWTQESPGIPGGSEDRDLFGTLAFGPE